MNDDRPTIEVRFGQSVTKSDLRIAQRYAALKLPGVDRRFFSAPEWEGKPQQQEINCENL